MLNLSDAGQLFLCHERAVRRWASRFAGALCQRDTDDIVQDVFLVAHRNFAKVKGIVHEESKIKAWLFRTTHNVARERRRRDRGALWLSGRPEDYALQLPAGGPSPLGVLEQEEDLAHLWAALSRLPPAFRTVFILFELEGRTGTEIANLMGAPLATVWVRLRRARQRVETALAKLPERGRG